MDRWHTRILLSSAAAAALAGIWLLALAVKDAVPPPGPIAPPPLSTNFSVTPGYSSGPTVYPVTAAVPVGVKPRAWRWYTLEGCHPALILSPACDRPTPSPSGYVGH